MSRLLVFVALAIFVWLALRRARAWIGSPRGQELRAMWRLLRQAAAAINGAPRASSGATSASAPRKRAPGPTRPVVLVRCSACGTHVPGDTARRRAQATFCSEACERRAVP